MNDYSYEHINYLKKIKWNNFFVLITRLFIIILFLSLWELFARTGFINTFLYSSPSIIIKTLYKLSITGELLKHLNITLFELTISFFLSTILGITIATIFWSCNFIHKVFDPYITVLNSLPKVALGPLIIIWFGASTNSIIFMSLLISVFITIINVYHGFNSTNENYITMIKSFGATKWQVFRYVVFPSNINNIISTLKINISMNLIGIIMGELLVSKKGIGYLIMYGSQVFNIDLVITCIFILGIISYIMYYLINKISR